MLTRRHLPPHMRPIFLLLLVALSHVNAYEDEKNRTAKDYEPDIEPYENVIEQTERSIFDYRKNGIRVDMKVVPVRGNESYLDESKDERFPNFPLKDIGRCIIDLSFICIEKRIARYLQVIGELREISLLGQAVKLVKTRVLKKNRRSSGNDVNEVIDRSIDDFFDTFVLRVTLPRWNGKNERSQIDLMFDQSGVIEGRGKGGGGGGGKGGGKCKKMMMMGMMAMKMKLIAIASIKGMMMSGMSLMLTMAMMASKFMKGGGYVGGGGGGQLKEIVLLTKGPSAPAPADSYGAPPPPSGSYGVPSGGDWQGGGGGGWGRSFEKPPNLPSYRKTNSGVRVNYRNLIPLIGEVVSHNNSLESLKSYEEPTVSLANFNGTEASETNKKENNNYHNVRNISYVDSISPVLSYEHNVFANEWQPSEEKSILNNYPKGNSKEMNAHYDHQEYDKSNLPGV